MPGTQRKRAAGGSSPETKGDTRARVAGGSLKGDPHARHVRSGGHQGSLVVPRSPLHLGRGRSDGFRLFGVRHRDTQERRATPPRGRLDRRQFAFDVPRHHHPSRRVPRVLFFVPGRSDHPRRVHVRFDAQHRSVGRGILDDDRRHRVGSERVREGSNGQVPIQHRRVRQPVCVIALANSSKSIEECHRPPRLPPLSSSMLHSPTMSRVLQGNRR